MNTKLIGFHNLMFSELLRDKMYPENICFDETGYRTA